MLVDFFIGYANLSLMIAIVLNYEKGYLKFKMQQWKSKCNKRSEMQPMFQQIPCLRVDRDLRY